MSHCTEDRDGLLGLLLPLDSSAGPARRISRQQALEMVRAALEAASVEPPVSQHPEHEPGPRERGLPRRARLRKTLR
jgi:hypothetical protein